MINRDFRELFAAFVAHDVRFLIVGGYAVAFHGHPRFTKDVDVLVARDPENARRVFAALADFGRRLETSMSRTFVTDQAADLSGTDLEAQVVDGAEVVVVDAQFGDVDHGFFARRPIPGHRPS